MIKKAFALIIFSFSFLVSFCQPIVNRSTGANTLVDPNLSATRSFRIPVYADTTQANSLYPVLDSCGRLIYTYTGNTIWKRSCSPKRWEELGAASSVNIYNSNGVLTGDRLVDGNNRSLIFDSLFTGNWSTKVFNETQSTFDIQQSDAILRTLGGNNTRVAEIGTFAGDPFSDGTTVGVSLRADNGSTDNRLNLSERYIKLITDSFKLPRYGTGTHIGTPTYTLQVDANGNVIEGVASGGISSIIGKNGNKIVGDSIMWGDSLTHYTYLQSLVHGTNNTPFRALVIGNLPEAQSLNGVVGYNPLFNTYNPSTLGLQRLYSTANGDINLGQYGGLLSMIFRISRDSADATFTAGGTSEALPGLGGEFVSQWFPQRDSSVLGIGRDGLSGNEVFAQKDIGQSWGYNVNVVPQSGLPGFPLVSIRSSIDFMRVIDNTRRRKMTGAGVTGFLSMYKTYQSTITGSTYEAGNYTDSIFGYRAYGDAYPLINQDTKAKALAVWTAKNVFGVYIDPQYRYTNTVDNGYSLYAKGDSDIAVIKGFTYLGNNNPVRSANTEGLRYRLYTNGKGRFTDSLISDGTVKGFTLVGEAIYASVKKSTGDETGVILQQVDSAQTGLVGAYMPGNRELRGIYIRSEGYNGATIDNNSTGFFVQVETGVNHANVTRWWRNGNMVVNRVPATTDQYRLYKKFLVNGASGFLDTITYKNAPTGGAAGDSINYKPLVIASNGDVFKGAWVGAGGAGTVTSVAAGYGMFFTTITSTGSVIADTAVGSSNALISWLRYNKFKDSVNAIFTPIARTITTGYGLTGGGDFSTNRTYLFDSATVFPQIRTSIFANIADQQIVYSNAGVPAGSGQMKFTGQTVQLASTNTTQTTTSSALAQTYNSLTSGTGQYIASSSLTSGNLINLVTTSTAKTGANTLLNINSSGANGSSSITNRGATISVTNTGTTSENRALELTASGATTNWAAYATAGSFRTVGAAGFYALNSAGTGGVSMTYDNGTIATVGSTGGGIRLDLEAASSTILARRPFTIGIGIDFGNNVSLDVYKSGSGTSNIQNWRSSGGTVLANVNQSGRFFIGSSTSATALLHIDASTTAANTAQIKLAEGSRQTTPEDGTINYVSNNIEFTETSTVYTLAKTLRATATLDFPSTSAQSSSDLTITVTGAVAGDPVAIAVPDSQASTATLCFTAWVSAADTVTIRLNNYSAITKDLSSASYTVTVIHF